VGTRRAAAIAALAAALALCPQFAGGVTPADAPGPLSLAEPVVQAKTPSDVYIVQLKQPGAAAYKGGLLGMPATKPVAGRRLDAGSAVVEGYVRYLEDSHQRLLTSIDARDARIYSFRYAFNGFAARLNGGELGRLARRPEVHRIWRDTEHHLSTNNSSLFLGVLDQQGGLRADLKLTGENVIVGIIDSGIAPGHPSLRDYEEEIPRACRSEWARASWLGRWLCHSVRNNPPTTHGYYAPWRHPTTYADRRVGRLLPR
jgi:subtilisin family serine protease